MTGRAYEKNSFGKKYKSLIYMQFIKAVNEYALIKEGDILLLTGAEDKRQLAFCTLMEYRLQSHIDFSVYEYEDVEAKELCKNLSGNVKIISTTCYDDAVEYIFAGLLLAGRMEALLPVEDIKGIKKAQIIRPFMYVRRSSILGWGKNHSLDEQDMKACEELSAFSEGELLWIRELLVKLENINPFTFSNIFSSASNVNLDSLIGYTDNNAYHFFEEAYQNFKPADWMLENYKNTGNGK